MFVEVAESVVMVLCPEPHLIFSKAHAWSNKFLAPLGGEHGRTSNAGWMNQPMVFCETKYLSSPPVTGALDMGIGVAMQEVKWVEYLKFKVQPIYSII